MSMRTLKFSEALAEATVQVMEHDPRLFIMGEGVDDPKGAFGTTLEAFKRFGPERVFDTPLSENAVTGIGIGAAIAGWPCLMVHLRSEFLLLAMDQVVNHAAKWRYMFGGKFQVPITIRCLIGRGWGQAAQHSQSFHSMFASVPGLKVILPSTPYDAKGLLTRALHDPDPVICVEHRWLYDKTGDVPEKSYEIPLGEAALVAEGSDITCVAFSLSVYDAIAARTELLKEGISMEILDPRSARPLDTLSILRSVQKTGRLVVCDVAGGFCGMAAQVAALAASEGFSYLKAPVQQVTLPEAPTPCSPVLEALYYPGPANIVAACRLACERTPKRMRRPKPAEIPTFRGPF